MPSNFLAYLRTSSEPVLQVCRGGGGGGDCLLLGLRRDLALVCVDEDVFALSSNGVVEVLLAGDLLVGHLGLGRDGVVV